MQLITLPAMGEAGVYFNFKTTDVLRPSRNQRTSAGLSSRRMREYIIIQRVLLHWPRTPSWMAYLLARHISAQAIGDRIPNNVQRDINWYVEGLVDQRCIVGIGT